MNFSAVVMAGGTGTRFWPVSRKDHPKQLVSLGDEPVMLEDTVRRLEQVVDSERILVVTARDHADQVREVCSNLPSENIFAEPEGRDTAAAAGFANYWVRRRFGDDTVMGLFPADHRIRPLDHFADAVRSATEAAREVDGLITFGIEPDGPDTGYGYVQYGSEGRTVGNHEVYPVVEFHEKPDRETARKYLENGSYLWNSGMFVWPVRRFQKELQEYMPELNDGLQELFTEWDDSGDRDQAARSRYPSLPETSVDYGILERSNHAWTIPVSFDWNDLGSWDALRDVFDSGDEDNVELGDVITQETTDSILVARDDVTVASVGVEGLIVVATDDAVLVCDQDRPQDVKKLVQNLQDKDREELL